MKEIKLNAEELKKLLIEGSVGQDDYLISCEFENGPYGAGPIKDILPELQRLSECEKTLRKCIQE